MTDTTLVARVLAAMHLGTIAHIQFVTPVVLWLLLALPAWWIIRATRHRPAITFSRLDIITRGPRASQFYARLLFVFRNLALISLIVAAARPRISTALRNDTREGINIMLVVDLSSSMLAEDFKPHNRLDVAKESLRRFILGRTSDRIGVVAFASEAVTQVPLTTDYPTLLAAVDRLDVGQLDDGTAIGEAIATATNRLRNTPGKSKVMIVMTDGVNNRGTIDPLTAAAVAQTHGIRIHTIGVGTHGVAPFPVDSGPGGIKFAMQPVRIDDTLLTRVALSTGGQYFRAQDGTTLRHIYEQINRMERSPISSTTHVHYTELFRWPLGLALVLLLLEMGVGAVKGSLP